VTSFCPRVSIVIPAYNAGNYLRQAIESALAQSWKNAEVLVVNDGSRDDGQTRAIARSYGDRIRYFEKVNGGVATALNLGIEQMRGDYFSWLSHDDVYRPDKVERQVLALAGKPAGTVAYCDFATIDAHGKVLNPHCAVSPRGEHGMRVMLAFGRETVHGCGLLIPAGLFEAIGRFDPEQRYTQDYDLWFRFAEQVPFVHIAEPLVGSRQHEGQDSRQKAGACAVEADRMHSRMLRKITPAEIEGFCDNSLEFLGQTQRIFANAGYVRTAAEILRHVARIDAIQNAGTMGTTGRLVCEQLLGYSEPHSAEPLWRRLRDLATGEKERPRILFYSYAWLRGGLERVTAILLENLKQRFELILVTSSAGEEGGYPLAPGITHIRLPSNGTTSIAERVASLAVLLGVDLVVGNANINVDFLDVYALLRDLGIKSIACNHYQFFLPYTIPWLVPVIEKRASALTHADVVTWPTHFSTNVCAQVAANAACMPNPCTFEVASASSCPAGKRILCVGRFHDAVKRLDRIMRVFAAVLVDHPDAELVVVGDCDLSLPVTDTPQQSYRDLIESLEIPAGSIRFMGEQEHVEDFYATASLLLLTSDSEGFGMVLTEAGSFGLPSAVFDVPGLDDIITDGENGFLVPQGDVAGLAARVSLLLADENLRGRMGRRARELAQRFGQSLISERFGALVAIVLASSDSQTLHEVLRDQFREPIRDVDGFTRRMIAEYERCTTALIAASRAAPQAAAAVPAVRSRKSWVKQLAVVRYANTNLFKPYVKPALRKAKNVFRPAA
jgi:glycosyltransferase involved in cell wall biosynthesis